MDTESPKRVTRRVRRTLLMILGSLFVLLGAIGIVVPLLPTTPFLLLASACYSLSSAKLARRLEESRVLGSYLRHWRTGDGVPTRTKVLAILWLWLGLAISMTIARSTVVYIILPIIGVIVTTHIVLIRKRRTHATESDDGKGPYPEK
ncbi:MAG: YbaN family protein [Sphaerochaeta sp.]|nr:YbaN family protein [Sphaerochaeta sp.]MDX9915608.1 YbaN family protein [Sphaerochaeta sp.]